MNIKLCLSLIYLRLVNRIPKTLKIRSLNLENFMDFFTACKKLDLFIGIRRYKNLTMDEKKKYVSRILLLASICIRQYSQSFKRVRKIFPRLWKKEKNDFVWKRLKRLKKAVTYVLVRETTVRKMHKFLISIIHKMQLNVNNCEKYFNLLERLYSFYTEEHEFYGTEYKPMLLWVNQETFGYSSLFNLLTIIKRKKKNAKHNIMVKLQNWFRTND